jgi:23S rRNA (guanosine2251-2'-O)-methyltransferase
MGGVERLVGVHPVREALRAGRRPLHRLSVRGRRRPEIDEIVDLARAAGLPIIEEDRREREREPGDSVSLEVGALPELTIEDLVGAGPRAIVALDGVEDPQNLGAICRVAEATGVAGLLLLRRRAPPISQAVSRASAGAVEHMLVARVPNLVRALNYLKEREFWVVAAHQEAEVSLFEAPEKWLLGPLVVVLGGEASGLRRQVLVSADYQVRVPMAGRVASLNVAGAAAAVLFERMRRERLAG